MATKSPAKAAREAGRTVSDAVKATASEHAADAKADVAARMTQEADGWRAAAAQFRGDHVSKDAVGCVADQLSDAASAVRSADLSSLRNEAEAVARKHPALFFGAAALAGFAVARALKASERAEMPDDPTGGPSDADLPAGVRDDAVGARKTAGAS